LAERTVPPAVIEALRARGHTVQIGPPGGSANSIEATGNGFVGASDGRTRGALAAGY
jgi:gamma-glutamyltranspeptidase/glutathione hydrolase